MPERRTLPDRVGWSREECGDEVLYRLACGLCIRTEVFHKRDPGRILPLGTPQGALINHLLHFPEVARGKRVLEPFAGAGPLGLAALHVGAEHVDFLDVNPRALAFQRRNAAENGIGEERFDCVCGDIAAFVPQRPYDVLLANPPFVPTPDGIAGTLTSNGGADGNRFVRILFERLETLLHPAGRAFVYVFQLVQAGRPLVADLGETLLDRRTLELTPSQERTIPLAACAEAYRRLFPAARTAVEAWRADLEGRLGADASLCHYVVEVGPRTQRPTRCRMRDDFAERFGAAFLVPSQKPEELAFGRVFENLVPG